MVARLKRRFGMVKDIASTIKNTWLPWDGKWRLLVFDIPEKHRCERRLLRFELYTSGFRRLQKSVWLTPYRVDGAFVDRLNSIGKLGGNIEFMVIESLSNAAKYKKLFGL